MADVGWLQFTTDYLVLDLAILYGDHPCSQGCAACTSIDSRLNIIIQCTYRYKLPRMLHAAMSPIYR
eukprot:scaffold516_cov401-Prasinococcus_capsulatus_cf.AAC.19